MSKAIREVTLRAFSIKSTKMSSDTDEFFERRSKNYSIINITIS